jgi:hypothetical protein
LAVLGRQVEQGFLSLLLFEDPREFGSHLLLFPFGNGAHHIALLMHQAALPQSCRKEIRHG